MAARGRRLGLALAAGALAAAGGARAQLVTSMVDRDGLSHSCVTVGPLAPIAQEYCVRRVQAEGVLLKSEAGHTGLTLGRDGAADGVIVAVAAGSPAAAAGLQAGDAVVSVDGQPAPPPADEVARQAVFGARDQTVSLTFRRGESPVEASLKRAAAPEPPGTPKSPNPLVGIHPVVNWRGVFIPCMGAGLLGPAAIGACLSHYEKLGYVRVSALGDTGLSFAVRGAEAVVSAVAPGSPAAAAGVQPGDVLTAVDAQPLHGGVGRHADSLLFGRIGETRRVVVRREGREVAVDLKLAAAG